jgi:hypothetical protein
MPSWINLQQEFRALIATKGYAHPEVFRWVVEHLELFPESRRNLLMSKYSYATSQTLECLTRDAAFARGQHDSTA